MLGKGKKDAGEQVGIPALDNVRITPSFCKA